MTTTVFMENRQIAFLGTGLMGAPMVRRLLQAGFSVTVWNRSPEKAQPLEADGANVAASAPEAVRGAGIIFTMVSDGDAVAQILLNQEVLNNAESEATFIDCSSISALTAQVHAQHLESLGFHYIDAPVSGGVSGAEQGCLAIMAGGEPKQIKAIAWVFEPLGRVTHVGPHGAGQVAKLANQQIVAITIGAVAEAMIMIEAAGGSRSAFRDAIRGGFAESRILELHGQRMIERNFTPGGPAKHQLKDLNNGAALAHSLNLDLPITETVRQLFQDFCEQDGGDLDHSALLVHLEHLNSEVTIAKGQS